MQSLVFNEALGLFKGLFRVFRSFSQKIISMKDVILVSCHSALPALIVKLLAKPLFMAIDFGYWLEYFVQPFAGKTR